MWLGLAAQAKNESPIKVIAPSATIWTQQLAITIQYAGLSIQRADILNHTKERSVKPLPVFVSGIA
jgi:hypothetical protein